MKRFFLLLSALVAGRAPVVLAASPYIEEATRKVWDRGCADWPVAISPSETFGIQRNPQIRSEKQQGYFRVYSHMKITPSLGESPADFEQSVMTMLLNPTAYAKWVMPGINVSPEGDRYFVTVDALEAQTVQPNREFDLTGPYSIQILWFKRSGRSTIETYYESGPMPACPFFAEYPLSAQAPVVKITYRMVPRPEILKMMVTEVYVLKSATGIDLRLRLTLEPSALVYQLLPETMLANQIDARGRRIFSNFLELRKGVGAQARASAGQASLPQSAATRAKK